MPRFSRNTLRVLALAAMATTFALPAHAQAERQRSRPPARRAVTFDVSGVYTGAYNGVLSIDGVGYPISPSAQVYLLGDGVVPLRMVPIGNRVYASGRGTLGSSPIEMLIARPVNDDRTRSNTELTIKLHDPNAPQ
ncbi:MAG: hypothetical protein ABL977_01205 [Candidatus Eisenbacteria bacterium]